MSAAANEQGGRPLKVAIVGLGKMGVMHAAMCSAAPGIEVAALVDVDPKLGGQVQSMGVEAPIFSSLDELFAADSLYA